MKKVDRDWSGHLLTDLAPFVSDTNFTPDMVTKKSNSARGLCMWILALHKYVQVVEHLKTLGHVPAGYQEQVIRKLTISPTKNQTPTRFRGSSSIISPKYLGPSA